MTKELLKNIEERFDEKFGNTLLGNPYGSALSRKTLVKINEDVKFFLSQIATAEYERGQEEMEKNLEESAWAKSYYQMAYERGREEMVEMIEDRKKIPPLTDYQKAYNEALDDVIADIKSKIK
jgi:hypothetical protein